MSIDQTRTELPGGYVTDWERYRFEGDRLALYGPMQHGARHLIAYAECLAITPAWMRGPAEWQWRAYRNRDAIPAELVEIRLAESFDSPDQIVAWLSAIASRVEGIPLAVSLHSTDLDLDL